MARCEISADALASALEECETLENSLADESELEAHYVRLCALHETLKQQHDETYAKLGRATYADLRADLAGLVEKADKAEQAAEAARLVVSDARQAIAGKLNAWPALASDARAKYASDAPRISHAERVLSALLALFDAMEDGRGKVPTVVNGVNILHYFNLSPEIADSVLPRSVGRVVDNRVRNQIAGLIEALHTMR